MKIIFLRSLNRSHLQPGSFLIVLGLAWFALTTPAKAGSATWLASPINGDWNTAENWTAGGPPNGTEDTATFAFSNITDISVSGTTLNGIVFDGSASPFTIIVGGLFIGVGITNNSGSPQNFVNLGVIDFGGGASAGNAIFINNGGAASGTYSYIDFYPNSTADSATFTNNGGTVTGAFGGRVDLFGPSSPGNATFTNNGAAISGAFGGNIILFGANVADSTFTNNGGAVRGGGGGRIDFYGGSAGNGTFTNNGGTVSRADGARTEFFDDSTAGNATLIANGGQGGGKGGLISFNDRRPIGSPSGGTARVEVFGNGSLDISNLSNTHQRPGVISTGSIEGSGHVFLGAFNLTVGSNNLTTRFSGTIEDGGLEGGTGGSLTKMGNGRLTLSKASTYTGGTTVNSGTLLVTNKTGSATGTGAVQVNGGTLGGTGIITGSVTVGTGTSSGAILLPGTSATNPETLTINSALTFNSLSTYQCVLKRSTPIAGQVISLGVTITNNVPFTFVDTGTDTLMVGTVFTVINNTSADPIFGTFNNLADGSAFTSNGNNFQASYEGGDGNDLTLTVVP